MNVVYASSIVAVAVLLLLVSGSDARRLLRASVTRTSWERSLGKADESVDLSPSDEFRLFIATSGPYAPGYVVLVTLDEPRDHVLVVIADPDSKAGLPLDMEPEGLPQAQLHAYVSSWGLRSLVETRYSDAILVKHFRNVLADIS